MTKLKIALGVGEFRRLREQGCYYVDKTMLVHELMSQGTSVTLFTRPRRFGKTLNMTMLREFFDITKDSKALFSDLMISGTESYQYLNAYPTLHFSFKDCKGDKNTLIRNIFEVLVNEYDKYSFTKERLSAIKQLKYERILEKLAYNQLENATEVSNAIQFLVEMLGIYYNKPVILLIDEYDTPLESAYAGGFYKEVHSFISGLYASALKDNIYLEKGVLTGIQRIAKENIFSGLNNLIVESVVDSSFNEYFGFTEPETRQLLSDNEMELSPEIAQMYNGYKFRGCAVYNPWSILNYVRSGKLNAYWVNTASNARIKSLILQYKDNEAFSSVFEELIAEGKAEVFINTTTAYVEEASVESLWALLLHAGYITLAEDIDDVGSLITIKIPNYEVKTDFKQMVAEYTNLKETSLKLLFEYLVVRQDIEAFKKVYQQLVYNTTSFYDAQVSKSTSENAYHMLFLGMCMFLDGYYEVRSNRESGDGRSDIILKARNTGYKHFVIEFKQGENLEKLAEEAIAQIIEKNYAVELQGNVVLLGAAHNKKRCYILDKEIVLN